MSYISCNLVIPACLPAVLLEGPVGATLFGDSHRESFLRKDSRQAGVTERVGFRLCWNDELWRTFVMQESINDIFKKVRCAEKNQRTFISVILRVMPEGSLFEIFRAPNAFGEIRMTKTHS